MKCLYLNLLIRKRLIAVVDDLNADGLVVQARGRAPVADARVPRAFLVLHDAVDLEADLKRHFLIQKARSGVDPILLFSLFSDLRF